MSEPEFPCITDLNVWLGCIGDSACAVWQQARDYNARCLLAPARGFTRLDAGSTASRVNHHKKRDLELDNSEAESAAAI